MRSNLPDLDCRNKMHYRLGTGAAVFNGADPAWWPRSTVQGRELTCSEATLNVLEPGGRRGVTGVEEKRLHLCHEHISVAGGSRAPSLAPKR